MDVLVLGDGNFTFSLCLAAHLSVSVSVSGSGGASASASASGLAATSYDTEEELLVKYPECSFVLRRLAAHGAAVYHRVDATDESTYPPCGPWNHVVFNHPHSGVEDIRRHRSLLCHFFSSAVKCLAPGGAVHVTLARGQSKSWRVDSAAERFGLRCTHAMAFPGTALTRMNVELDLKRHQTGKSFARQTAGGGGSETRTFTIANAIANAESGAVATKPPWWVSLDDGAPASAPKAKSLEFLCAVCGRTFSSEMGLKNHHHMVHELGIAGTQGQGAVCPHCGKHSPNEDSLRQHVADKHTGPHRDIKPDWHLTQSIYVEEEEVTSGAEIHFNCAICGYGFANELHLRTHLDNLRPISKDSPEGVKELPCLACGRIFRSSRSLKQHENCCSSIVIQ
jgi:hypothetical protein